MDSSRDSGGIECQSRLDPRSDADSGLPDALRPVLAEGTREIRELEARVRGVERSL
jgi:hypothetical protein